MLSDIFKNRNRNVVILTQVINAVIALISGKLIAIYITPTDFGNYNIQFATYSFFLALLISPFIQFIKTSNKTLLPKIGTKYFSFTFLVLIILTIISVILFLNHVYNIWDPLLFLIFLVFIPLSIVNSVLGDFMNIEDNMINFSKFSLLKAFSSLIFIALFFLLGMSFIDNVKALWVMQLIGALLGLIFFSSKYIVYKAGFVIAYKTFFKKYIRFTGPLMFLAIWSWVNNYFDRYAIEYFLSLEEVGIYNASYGVGSKFFLMLSPIFMILLTPLVYSNDKLERKKKSIYKYSFYFIFISMALLGIIYYLKNIIGILLLSENYQAGFFIIFWIALAYFFLTLSYLFESLFYSEHKTNFILISNIISAIVNIVLNIILIPIYGIIGATLATCCAFGVHLIIIYYNFKKL